ncbi:sensor histidine kinase [Nocardia sp. NPDC058058]|uniref:sensor histidine kinase n=1 Tax=Nocardia sp. NPDC058058 TaxID=3346317 RepID=UPI0036DB85CD
MGRLLFALCVLPGGLGALVELTASGSFGQTLVDLLGAAGGIYACLSMIREDRERVWRRPGVLVGVAALVIAMVVVWRWPESHSPWATASAWVAIVACGVAASRIAGPFDAVLTAVLGVAAVGSVLGLRSSPADDVLPLLVVTIPTITALGIGLLVRSHRQRLVIERGAAVADERAQMARELHDVIAHEVMGMVVLAQAGQLAADERTRPLLTRIEGSGRRALDDIRALVGNLHDGAAPTGTTDLADLVERFADTAHAEVVTELDERVRTPDVPDPVLLAAHRILLEAFNNIRRHAADASRVDVTVRLIDDAVDISVCDNGTGFAGLGGGGGVGLTGLAERATAVGGTVTAGRLLNGHWRLAARLPVAESKGGI